MIDNVEIVSQMRAYEGKIILKRYPLLFLFKVLLKVWQLK